MTAIRFEELKEVQEKMKIKPKTISLHGLDIEVKQYLHIDKKLTMLIESMLSTSDETGLDRHLFEISLITKIVENYTNVELPDSVLEGYNIIKELGIIDGVVKAIPESEMNEISELKTLYIQSEEEKAKVKASFSYTAKTVMETIENTFTGEHLESLMGMLGDR